MLELHYIIYIKYDPSRISPAQPRDLARAAAPALKRRKILENLNNPARAHIKYYEIMLAAYSRAIAGEAAAAAAAAAWHKK